jgi:hypothetical protein
VKKMIAVHQRRLDLQMSYFKAVVWGEGFGTDEAKAALARVGEFAGLAENPTARFATYDGQCVISFMRGAFSLARQTAETYLREAEAGGRAMEARAARRLLGLVSLFKGELKSARSILEQASEYIPERDILFPLGSDSQLSAMAYLSLALWHLGEVERARELIQQSIRRADELGHVPTMMAVALFWKTVLETRREDASAAGLTAEALLKLSEQYGIKTYADVGKVYANWAHGKLLDPEAGASELRQALAAYVVHGNRANHHRFMGCSLSLKPRRRIPIPL